MNPQGSYFLLGCVFTSLLASPFVIFWFREMARRKKESRVVIVQFTQPQIITREELKN